MGFLGALTSSRLKQQHNKQGQHSSAPAKASPLSNRAQDSQTASHTEQPGNPFITMVLSKCTGRSGSQFHLPLPERIRALLGSNPLCRLLQE